eukprot:2735123-Amphidinium_carterae.1
MDIWGGSIANLQTVKVAPCVTAVPMGWSWAFWFVQRLHTHILQRCGFHGEQILSGAWPVTSIGEDPVSLPYCDNVTMISTNKVKAERARDQVVRFMEGIGIEMHEINVVSAGGDTLGAQISTNPVQVSRRTPKAKLLQQVLLAIAAGRQIDGRQLEKIIGHFTFCALFRRCGLSVFRAGYTFVADSYCLSQVPWDSVRYECWVAAFILPLLYSRWDIPWAERAFCSDACETGWGVCSRPIAASLARECGR